MNKPNPKPKKREHWPRISKILLRGEVRYMLDCRKNGTGDRLYFATRKEAEGEQLLKRTRRENEGGAAFDDKELSTFGLSIADAIKFTLAHYRQQDASILISEAVAHLIQKKQADGASVEYCRVLRQNLERVAAHFGERKISTVTTGELDDFISGLALSAWTRKTFRRDIRTLWTECGKRKWADAQTAKETTVIKPIDAPPGILTPKQAADLLVASADDELRAFHALGLFAGLRVAEIKRLEWKDIDFEGGFINISASVSKTRSRRLVPILDALRKWISPIAKSAGKIVSRDIRKLHEAARTAAGIAVWPDNGMRHSFVSYRLAATGDAARTALECGHDQAVLFAHYRELVKPKDAAIYFQIVPA